MFITNILCFIYLPSQIFNYPCAVFIPIIPTYIYYTRFSVLLIFNRKKILRNPVPTYIIYIIT